MTALHFHRRRSALPGWDRVRTEQTVSFDPELRTAGETMAGRWEQERQLLTDEVLLVGAVRSWVEFVLPGDAFAADAAAGIALEELTKTHSAAAAFEQARQFIGSWMRHPSHRPEDGISSVAS